MKDLESKYIECSCCTPEHTIKFTADLEGQNIFVSTQLSSGGFFKRLWTAFKYVFGKKSQYGLTGQWEETILDREQFIKLLDFFHDFGYRTKITTKTGRISEKKIRKALDNIEGNTVYSNKRGGSRDNILVTEKETLLEGRKNG